MKLLKRGGRRLKASANWHDPTSWTDRLTGIAGNWQDNVSTIPASVINGIIENMLWLHANRGGGGTDVTPLSSDPAAGNEMVGLQVGEGGSAVKWSTNDATARAATVTNKRNLTSEIARARAAERENAGLVASEAARAKSQEALAAKTATDLGLAISGRTLSVKRDGTGGNSVNLPEGGGAATVVTKDPISGNGTPGDPVTLGDHKVGISKLPDGAQTGYYLDGDGTWKQLPSGGGTPNKLSFPEWADDASDHAFKTGDLRQHNGLRFLCIKDHVKGGTGPDGDPTNWDLLDSWFGEITAKAFYPEGVMGLTGSGDTLAIWQASEFVLDTDPLPTDAANTKWVQINGGGGGGGETGQVQEIHDGAVGDGFDVNIDKPGDHEVFILVVDGASASLTFANVNPNLRRLLGRTIGNTWSAGTAQTSQLWNAAASENAERLFRVTAPSNATLHMFLIRPSAAPSAPTQKSVYPAVKPMIVGGSNIDVEADDDSYELKLTALTSRVPKAPDVIGGFWGRPGDLPEDETDAVQMRERALTSNDVRTQGETYSFYADNGHAYYGYDQVYWKAPNTDHWPGYDASRPGMLYNGVGYGARDLAYFDSNGVDWTGDNAGTTTREFDLKISVYLKQQTYSGNETVQIGFNSSGRLRLNGAGGDTTQRYQHPVLHWLTTQHIPAGDPSGPLVWNVKVTFTGAPRVGNFVDSISFWYRDSMAAYHMDHMRLDWSLPALGGPRPTQDLDVNAVLHGSDTILALGDYLIPGSLAPLRNTDNVSIARISPGTNDHRGKNTPTETDKSDVIITDSSGDPLNLATQWAATQDLSRVLMDISGIVTPAEPGHNIYICSRIEDVTVSYVLNRLELGSANGFSTHIDMTGVKGGQQFWMLFDWDVDIGRLTDTVIKWNANLDTSTPKRNTLVPGVIDTARWEFDGTSRNSITLTGDGPLDAAELADWQAIRLWTGKASIPFQTAVGGGVLNGIGTNAILGIAQAAGGNTYSTWPGSMATNMTWRSVHSEVNGKPQLAVNFYSSTGVAFGLHVVAVEVDYLV